MLQHCIMRTVINVFFCFGEIGSGAGACDSQASTVVVDEEEKEDMHVSASRNKRMRPASTYN